MGRVIIPSELTAMAKDIKTANQGYRKGLWDILPALSTFSENTQLEGEAWSSIKIQLSDYQGVIRGALSVINKMDSDCDKLSSQCGSEILIEDDIRDQIKDLQASVDDYKSCITDLEKTLKKDTLPPRFADKNISALTRYRNAQISTSQLIVKLNEKLEKIEEIDETTSQLFTNATKTLDLMNKGIDFVTGSWNGSGFDIQGDRSWKEDLEKAHWTKYNRKILEEYFVLDEEGNIQFIKPGALKKFVNIFERMLPYIKEENAGAVGEVLTDKERYLLTFLTVKFGPDAYESANSFVRALEKGGDLVEALTEHLGFMRYFTDPKIDLIAGTFNLQDLDLLDLLSQAAKGEDVKILTKLLSFTFMDGKLVSLDRPTSIQARGGFSDYYDFVSKLLGMDIDTDITVFNYNGREYRLQTWDGHYGGGYTIGGEIGLYSRSAKEAANNPYIKKDVEDYAHRVKSLSPSETNNLFVNFRSHSKEKDQIPMELTVYDKHGNEVLKNKTTDYAKNGTHYWNFAAAKNPDLKYSKEDTYVVGVLTIKDAGLRKATKKALEADGAKVKIVGNKLKVTWK